MNHNLRWALATFALAGACLAHATDLTFTVTRTDDPAPNGCAVGDCSLREAVLAANANAGGINSIMLDAATYAVGAPRLDALGDLRLLGKGSAQTSIIETGGVTTLAHSGESLLVQGVTLDTTTNDELFTELFAGGDHTALIDVAMPNTLGRVSITGGSDAVIEDSDFRGAVRLINFCALSATTSQFVDLLLSQADVSNCSVTLDRIVVDGSLTAESSGLGVYMKSAAGDSTFAMFHSVIKHATNGMVLTFADGLGKAGIEHMRYLDNDQPLRILGLTDAYIQDCEFADNHHDDITTPEPGALWVNGNAAVQVLRSTFSGNRGTASAGGAVRVDFGASLSLVNSTFANNTFAVAAAEAGVRGAAVGYHSNNGVTTLILKQVTIVPPALIPAGVSGTTIGGDGGDSGLVLSVSNSILRGSCRLDADAMDVAIGNISTGTSCQLTAASNQTGVSSSDIDLGTLDYHGGYTRTYLPGADSVAIDAGSGATCLDEDQRGYPRPLGNGCDVGAVETGDVLFANGFE